MSERPDYLPRQGPFRLIVAYRHLLKGGNLSKRVFKHTLRREIPRGVLQSAQLGKENGLNLLGLWTRQELGCKPAVIIVEILRVDDFFN